MNVTLFVVQGKPAGKELVFPPGEYYFGRGVECQIRPNSEWVSRQHCLLRVAADGAYLRDLGSRNGTLVNGELLIQERRLHAGDHIQIGPLVFEARPEESLQAQPVTGVIAGDQTVQVGDKEAMPESPEILESTAHFPVLASEEQTLAKN